eukprot:14335519-Ditylum_brightwellii.AAC.1
MNWMVSEGFGGIMSRRRDCISGDIPGEYPLKKKTDTSDRTKVSHFFNPAVDVKNVDAVTEMTTDVDGNGTKKEKTTIRSRKRWIIKILGIEMNVMWQFYLKTYGIIDTIDHYFKN